MDIKKEVHYYDEAQLKAMGVDPDLDKDGIVTDEEISILKRKLKTQREMAWIAMLAILFFTAMLFTPIISVDRVDALGDLLGLFYIAMAGVVGSYMGFSTWMSRK
jgi:hypothetical protein